jgi:hypothetical protein
MSETLDARFEAAVKALGPTATTVRGGAGDLFMEIQNPETRETWMCCEPVTKERISRMKPAAPFVKSGYGLASMDRAAFAHSPQNPDEFTAMDCGGEPFRHVATPLDIVPPAAEGGPMRVTVDKHHLLGFDAGRELAVLELDGKSFIEVIGSSEYDEELVLPDGAWLQRRPVAEPLVLMLPEPTTTFFWFGEEMRSFQGPVESWSATR